MARFFKHHFDTYKFVQRLEQDGFSRESADNIMMSLSQVVDESIGNLSKNSVTIATFEKTIYMQRVDFGQIKSEIQLLEKNEFALLRQDILRLNSEVDKLRVRVADDLLRLDLSLDKGLIRDQQAAQELRIRETESKIDSELACVRTILEMIQWDLFKTLFPIFSAAGALTFSYLRFVS